MVSYMYVCFHNMLFSLFDVYCVVGVWSAKTLYQDRFQSVPAEREV